jgi:ATP-binding cassette subfamily B protein
LSAVDTSTEDAIIDTLKPIIKGRTTIIIAHRVSAMRLADRIIVLDKGRIVEDGTHQELMAKGGYYADLVEKQKLATQIGQEGIDA